MIIKAKASLHQYLRAVSLEILDVSIRPVSKNLPFQTDGNEKENEMETL